MNFNITLDKAYFESVEQEWSRLLYLVSNQMGKEKIKTENQIAELTRKIFMMEQFYFLREKKERMLNNEV
ncbi:MAG TPA: hypothetical protein DCW90_23540 [Lachnospiraceae bacterium]|nr:hypothetical protein [Lachnospiraceae bacterium]